MSARPLLMLAWLLAALSCLGPMAARAATLAFTVNVSEPVTVTGTPRLAIDVGGVTRYASYVSGSGSAALLFTYAVQAGDFDGNGIALASPLQLNGGTITDSAGNQAANLAFSLPNTAAVKVQTYTASLNPVSNTTATAAGFTITGAPTGASFSYTIGSSGGTGTVSGSGTISGSPHAVSGVDVSSLATGTLTLSVTVSTAAGGTGAAKTASVTPSFSGGMLDSLPGTAAAFSVRRLRSAYTGALLQVRRASDGAVSTIAPTLTGQLDTTSLTGFCGSGTCTVSAWYDQSGNGRNATQASVSAQPALVSAGVLEQLNSRPGVRFTTAKGLSTPSPLASSNEFTVSMVLVERVRAINTTLRLLASTATSNHVLAHIPYSNGTFYFDLGTATSPNRVALTWPVATGTPAIATLRNSASAATRSAYASGQLLYNTTGFAWASDLLAFGEDYQGHISEVVLFPSSISNTDRVTLERAQGAYYGISVP